MEINRKGNSCHLRKGRFSAKGQIYLVTTCTTNREPVFSDFYLARKLINILRLESDKDLCFTIAYVVMPDHLHWLLELHNESLSLIIGRIKSLSARESGRKIWQSGFHDHCLRREENVRKIARYIVMNPVRAGLVERPGLYPHWDLYWI